MNQIAFRFTSSPLASNQLTYNPSLLDSEQRLYEGLKFPRPFLNKSSEKGVLLNGRQYENINYANKEYEITITADELDASDIAFFEAFWMSPNKYISYLSSGYTWTNYIKVVTDSGRLPISNPEDLEFLYELAFKLYSEGVI